MSGVSEKKDDNMRRAVRLVGLDTEFELGKVVEVNLKTGAKRFIYFEEMDDGKWRLCYTKETISDIKRLRALKIIRE